MKTGKKLIYGCMSLGGGWNGNPISADDVKHAAEAVETALGCGISTFDHADIYTNGKAEETFGRVLKEQPSLRDRMIVQTKAGIVRGTGPGLSNTYNHSPGYIRQQVEQSLRALHIDYLDALLLHRPDPLMEPHTLAELFSELRNSGKVRAFGVSNMPLETLRWLQSATELPLIANQVQLSLGHSALVAETVWSNTNTPSPAGAMSGLLPYAAAAELELQAWRPLDAALYLLPGKHEMPEVNATRALVQELAEQYTTNPSAILLAWLLRLPGRVVPVFGTGKTERIIDAAEALNVDLSREDWYRLWVTAEGRNLP